MEAASQTPQILQSYWKKQVHETFVSACVVLISWLTEETSQVHEKLMLAFYGHPLGRRKEERLTV